MIVKFEDINIGSVFSVNGVEFVKRTQSNGLNAFNLDTGVPVWFYSGTICEIKED